MMMRDLLETSVSQCPSLELTASDILEGKEKIREMDESIVDKVRDAFKVVLETKGLPDQSTIASSPLSAELLWGWAEFADDPDGKTLAEWVRHGAPLGFSEPIKCNGVFPRATGLNPVDAPTESELVRPLEGWMNWPSANEEREDLHRLIRVLPGHHRRR